MFFGTKSLITRDYTEVQIVTMDNIAQKVGQDGAKIYMGPKLVKNRQKKMAFLEILGKMKNFKCIFRSLFIINSKSAFSLVLY